VEQAEGLRVPHAELLAYLNTLPGAPLTMADLKARMRQ
jgi:hypothetical protein